MAMIATPTPDNVKAWNQWVEKRPACVRAVAEKFNPWTLYQMKSTGHRVLLYSFGEAADGTVTLTVTVLGKYNLVAFDRNVFGIDPNDLVECELPAQDEPVGAAMTQEEAEENMDEMRLKIRPDLFTRAPDGSVVRKDVN